MNIKHRLTILHFLQFFIWGAWLISAGGYMFVTLGFEGVQIGAVYAAMGITSLFMPGLTGIIADRWVNAERVLGACHLIGAAALVGASMVTEYSIFYTLMFIHLMAFMPTIALSNAVSYSLLEKAGLDVTEAFPPIRVWGTVGFILAMWSVDFMGWTKSPNQFLIAAGAAALLGLYSFLLPQTKPVGVDASKGWVTAMGLDAFVLFKEKRMAVFFIFSMLLGAALQITNAFGGPFLDSFSTVYPDSFGVQHPNLLLSISQISETLFILTIPFFLKRFGIKKIMVMSMLAWVARFALFGIGDPAGGLVFLILSMVVYGMAFDFFNISGSIFIEQEADPKMRASAQGLFMIMTNGFGALIGGVASGWVVDLYTTDGVSDWSTIWFVFAGYALLLAIVFPFVFHYKHKPEELADVAH
ncbi:nucleoside permease [Bradymonas sediminis]|uniref:MFS transporter n=1 Tax=Bradymonas sediminis TaxID=1548548 RepID=A0A2Z4FR27_9DELT|nr:nucleoside permease [Bradymonas sediminis]AWV91443.1 MFS transporter [Bradymonas sediminis]TDP72217.1 NHS family xanthosine MFS transporter [Bradymonas sediminis]